MVPPDERLERRRAAVGQRDDRLVDDRQLLVGHRALELVGERAALAQRVPHRRVEDPVLVLAAALGLVQRDVGLAEHLVGAVLAGRADRHADAHVHPHALTANLDPGLEVRQEPARNGDRVHLAARAVEEQGELVAAQAGRGVALAEAAAETVGDRAEQLVARVVAVAVVDGLELVDVEQEHADAGPAAVQRVLQPVVEERAVGELRERVVESLALELLLERLELAHRLLEAVVLERDRHVAGERLEETQVLVREVAVHALAAGDGEQPDTAGLAVQRGHDAVLHAARVEVLAQAEVLDAMCLDRAGRGRRRVCAGPRPAARRSARASGGSLRG